jgi:16S rRNA (guanine(966)-N(2))-methyltransferase RsmD
MAELRIIRGTARGMKLRDVPGESTRPITDMVKEALYNIIGDDIVNASMWDLFAGTGSVSIEALSRGAKFARMTDLDRFAVETLHKNLEHTRLADKGKVIRADVFLLLKRTPDTQFDYIYVAPPQYKELWIQSLKLLDINPDWLVQDGWIIVQIHPREYSNLELTSFEVFDERKYGNTLLVFYRRKEVAKETTISPD